MFGNYTVAAIMINVIVLPDRVIKPIHALAVA